MGCFSSKPNILPSIDGDGQAFLDKYAIDKILGQGEFGVVKLVHEKNPDGSDGPTFAAKILRKGRVFKDNTLYSPIKPTVLRLECKILRTLGGKHHNLKLVGVYESPSVIYIVTSLCTGGDMFHYVSDVYGDSALRTEDVSRISFQLFDAVSHCAKHGIIHRDIKPENIMFKDLQKGAQLQLIDFGSGTMSTDEEVQQESVPKPCKQANGDILLQHATFAGSAFYISPEMFQRNYTCKTDVWSAAVSLYVLVAGYPSKDLQSAFNQVQNSKNPENRIEQIRNLPNMPEMPDTYFEMLEHALVYRHKKRMDAKTLLECEFIQFHALHAENAVSLIRTESSVVQGAAFKHIEMRKYRQYERGITTLIASVLSRTDLVKIMNKIDELIAASPEDHMEVQQGSYDISIAGMSRSPEQMEELTNKRRLRIVLIYELYQIITDLGFHDVLKLMKDQAHGMNYSANAYHVALLRQFVTVDLANTAPRPTQNSPNLDNSMSRKLDKVMASHKEMTGTNHSSDDEKIPEETPSSVHGNNVWDTIKKQMNRTDDSAGIKRSQSAVDFKKMSQM